MERPVGEVAQLAALIASSMTRSAVWFTCGAVALIGDLVLAAEGVKAAAELTAAIAAEHEQGAELLALRVAARALERARVASGSRSRAPSCSRCARRRAPWSAGA